MTRRDRIGLIVLAVTLSITALIVLFANRRPGPRRVALSGTVAEAGMPISSASLRLIPASGNCAPVAATMIVNGRYRFSNDDGPFPGSYQALVTSEPESLSKQPGAASGESKSKSNRGPDLWEWSLDLTIPDVATFAKDLEL